ncbi:hypothetical protein BJ508DRAFT_414682 [Ascobolus immersus RN42]|uniref:25S rRNA (uridine-N(3))-methyltransferase BMT5-like domain-containing protein n=1 Tax=Ascobolus immersus RN42 TaxID=1160509 RepID=A0A3N4IJ11_ASCIM|nr:hypothetical protein BJ508DRAFT_414682 [Ascobolus immersus RN42]
MPKVKGPLRKHQTPSKNPYHKPPAAAKSVFKNTQASTHAKNIPGKNLKGSKTDGKNKKGVVHQGGQRPTLPFNPEDTTLLLGEGNFTFARALIETHGCYRMTCTSYDKEEEVYEKYPDARKTIEDLKEEEQRVLFGIDARKLDTTKGLKNGVEKGGFERVVWMFPHVGGLSKDLDRQVRANQELLLGFFKSVKSVLLPTGLVIVTLFSSPHYDAWNIKGLAKSQGFRVQRSFKFLAEEFPGYRHARTVGNIEKGGKRKGGKGAKQPSSAKDDVKKDGESKAEEEEKNNGEDAEMKDGEEEERPETGGWKGEEREARMYLFELDDGKPQNVPKVKKDPKAKQKIKRGGGLKDADSSDEE